MNQCKYHYHCNKYSTYPTTIDDPLLPIHYKVYFEHSSYGIKRCCDCRQSYELYDINAVTIHNDTLTIPGMVTIAKIDSNVTMSDIIREHEKTCQQ